MGEPQGNIQGRRKRNQAGNRSSKPLARSSSAIKQVSSPFCFASMCSDGTCDGCNFHFLWESVAACPLCSAADYHTFVSSCVAGIQVGCPLTGDFLGGKRMSSKFLVFLPNRKRLTYGENQRYALVASPYLSRESPSAKR